MKVVAINSSPMMGKGNTALILTPFLAGMEEAAAVYAQLHMSTAGLEEDS